MSRYIKVASTLGEGGHNVAGSLTRLPGDVLKLESLCRLKISQIKKIAQKMDLQTASRAEILKTPRNARPDDRGVRK